MKEKQKLFPWIPKSLIKYLLINFLFWDNALLNQQNKKAFAIALAWHGIGIPQMEPAGIQFSTAPDLPQRKDPKTYSGCYLEHIKDTAKTYVKIYL